MSTGISKIGAGAPITPKEKASARKNSKKEVDGGSSVKDSIQLSKDGLKLEEMFQQVRLIKKRVEEKPELAAQVHGFVPEKIVELFDEKASEVKSNLDRIMKSLKENSDIADSVHSLDAKSVLSLLES
ncbi:MAG: hypothetical protein GXO87_10835 [Chlorobi bacterium]|nr:hypothetical protein [Chlorobiota bacterium]